MNAILIKIFATALALGQVTTRPDAVKTQFDPVSDRAEVVQILRDGCAHMRKAFDIEDINLDALITTAMSDPQAVPGDIKALHGLNLNDLHMAYREFCKNETVETSVIDVGQMIEYYDKAVADLPDHTKLKDMRLPGTTRILDRGGERFAELYEPDHRRIWMPLSEIPKSVQQAFIATEDKRFYQHKGIDERGLIRAFVANLAQPGRPQGGSTITQQVVKNLLVGNDVTYDRKIREMIVASRLERTLTKDEILQLYLNSIYLGRSSWGVELAARSYFGKSAKDLTLAEAALLASLAKGPTYFNPDRHPDRARERLAYVLSRMQEDGAITADEAKQATGRVPRLVASDRARRDTGFYFGDHIAKEAKALAGIENLTSTSYTVRSTVQPALQRAAEFALQEGLARYELDAGRLEFHGAEANLAEAVRRIESEPKSGQAPPAWLQALEAAHLPLYDVHWAPAVVVDKAQPKGGGPDTIRVGLGDGRVLPLATWTTAIRRALQLYDLVYVNVVEAKGKTARAELRVRPTVQGAALVIDNKSGAILAMAGGFSYPLSQLNRTTQASRQPGSTLKPLTYLAALSKGLQPNTLVLDSAITLPPVGGDANAGGDYWSPRAAEDAGSGVLTLRRAIENSRNLATVHLLDGGITPDPERSLDRICELAMEARLYQQCVRYYPFVLGAQPLRLIDLAAFYAAIANEGARPTPFAIESIEDGDRTVYRHAAGGAVALGSADRVAFYQLKTMLQGVVERGTARAIHKLSPYVGGKTGTTDNENDAWFVGFTNDVTVAIWVGYDNADGKRRTLGGGESGAKVALPIFAPIVEASWSTYAPKTPLRPPSPEAQRQLIALPIDLQSGDRVTDGRKTAFVEQFRLDQSGRFDETQFNLVPREEVSAYRSPGSMYDDGPPGTSVYGNYATSPDGTQWDDGRRAQAPTGGQRAWATPPWRRPNLFWPWGNDDDRAARPPARVDPDYFWGGRRGY